MARSAKRSTEEVFDVEAFLRPTDTDLRSALHTLLGTNPAEEPVQPIPGINLTPGIELKPTPVKLIPGIKLRPGPVLDREPEEKKRSYPVRLAETASDGHSRAEEQIYKELWEAGEADGDGSRILTIGYVTLGRLVGLSESNVRINVRSLIRKLSLEEHTTYHCEAGRGRTWRIFSPERILERRREAGLIWYSKRTLAVVFVDGETGRNLLS